MPAPDVAFYSHPTKPQLSFCRILSSDSFADRLSSMTSAPAVRTSPSLQRTQTFQPLLNYFTALRRVMIKYATKPTHTTTKAGCADLKFDAMVFRSRTTKRLFNKLDSHKATGGNMISAAILKCLATPFAIVVHRFFSRGMMAINLRTSFDMSNLQGRRRRQS